MEIVFNNCAIAEGYAIAGTRGWFYDDKTDKKVLAREAGRLDTSLNEAEKTGLPILTFLHYPPVYSDSVCEEIFSVLKAHNVKTVYYGHIHGNYTVEPKFTYEGIEMNIISADYLKFVPKVVK